MVDLGTPVAEASSFIFNPGIGVSELCFEGRCCMSWLLWQLLLFGSGW